LISWESLKAYFMNVLPEARKADINPHEFKAYFETSLYLTLRMV
jgi:hypothetical protein